MKTMLSVMAVAMAMMVSGAMAQCPSQGEKKAACKCEACKCEACGCTADSKKADCKCDKCACCKKDAQAPKKTCCPN